MSEFLSPLDARPQTGKSVSSPRPLLRRASFLMPLEQRFMFDGAAATDAAHAAGDAAVLAQIAAVPAAVEVRAADPALDNGKKEAVLVDTSVADYKTLEAGLAAGVAIIEFDGSKDGLAQIARWAAGQSGYEAIHILSHGGEATLNLGTTVLTDSRLSDSLVQAELAELGHALKAGGDLLLYGCDLAANSDGAQFLGDLAAATGADVAASTDATGAAAKGGDWTLEAATGAIEATAISAERMADFGDVLAVVNLTSPVGSSGNVQWAGAIGGDTFKVIAGEVSVNEGYSTGTASSSYMEIGNFITNFQAASDVIDFSAVVGDFTTSSIVLSKVASYRDPATNEILVTSANSDGTRASTSSPSGTAGTMVAVSGGAAWYVFFLPGVTYTDLSADNFFFAGPTTSVTGASLSNDTGSSNSDFVTNTASQTISGTLSANLASGEKVEVSYDGGSNWSDATTYSVGSNTWSTTTTLSGSNTFKARVTNTDGSTKAYSHSYTLDTSVPNAPSTPDLAVANDSGSSSTDNITSATTPAFTGTAEAGSTVTLYDGASSVGTATADGSGNWSITSSTLAEGSHTLTAKATDLAGNTSAASASLSVTIDTSAPSAPSAPDMTAGTDTGTSSTDSITSVTTPTFTGTAEANSTVKLYNSDGTTELGTATTDGSGNWSITSIALSAGTHTLTVKATDAAGNTSTASSSLSVTIDSTAPGAPSTPDMTNGTDSGSSATDNLTGVATPTFTGTAEANSIVTLYDGASSVGTTTADGSGNWSITASTLAEGSHTLTAKATEAAGNTSAASSGLSVTIDTTAPSAPSAPDMTTGTDSGSSSTDNITSNTTPTFTGTAEANSTVTLYDGASAVGTATADGSGNWSITASTLSAGSHTLTAKATDAAGNTSAASSSLSVTIDTTAPTTPTVNTLSTANTTPTLTGTATLGAGETLTVTVGGATYNVTPSGGNWSLDLSSATPASGTLSLSANNTYSVTATATDTAGNNASDATGSELTILAGPPPTTTVSSVALSADTGSSSSDFITNTAAQTVSGTLSAATISGETVQVSVDGGNNWSTATNTIGTNTFTLGTTLSSGTDTGTSSTDNITGNTTPTFTGTAEAGSTVKLYDTDGTTELGTATATGGNWSITASTLAAGSHTLTAKATDTAGNTSAASSSLSVTIDTTVPSAPATPNLADASDSGSSNTDNITNVTTPTITGTAEANATVKLYDTDGTTELGTATADGSGNWSITASTLSAGSHTLIAKATDAAGNTSAASSSLSITIDTAAPSAPTTPDLIAGTDSGSSSTDNITSNATPTFTGTAEANSTVALYDGASSVGTATADGSGNWSITASTLSSGSHTLTAKATDAAGNTSAASSSLSVTIDTTAPAVTSVSVPANGSYKAGTNLDFTVNFDEAVTVSGPPRIALTVGSTTVYADYLSGSGSTALVFRHTVAAGSNDTDGIAVGALGLNGGSLLDAAGNSATLTLNSVGSTASVLVDTAAPTTTIAGATFSNDTGSSSTDLITKTAAQTVSGTLSTNLASGETVKVSLNGGTTWTNATATVGQNTWSLAGQTLTASNTLKVKVTDAAGNDGTVFSQAYTLDATAPVLAGATVNGSQLVLTYTETTSGLDGTASLQTAEYAVTVGGVAATVNSVAIDAAAKTVTLTLATAVKSGDTVTVSYTGDANDTHQVRDAAGNLAANLSNSAVTNNTAADTPVVPPPPVISPSPLPTPPSPTPPAPPRDTTPAPAPTIQFVPENSPVNASVTVGTPATNPNGTPASPTGGSGTTPTIPTLTPPSTVGGFQALVVPRAEGAPDTLVVATPIRDMSFGSGGRVSVQIASDAFGHTNPNATVTLVAQQANGAALPAWMNFNPQTGKFEGVPPPGFRGTVAVRVVARDSQGREAVQVFKIVVGAAQERGQGQGEGQDQGRGQDNQRRGMSEHPAIAGRSGFSDQLRASRQAHLDRLAALSRSAKAALAGRA